MDKAKQLIAKCVFITDIVAILYNRMPEAFGTRQQADYRHYLYKKFFGEGFRQVSVRYGGNVATIKARINKMGYMFYLYTDKL